MLFLVVIIILIQKTRITHTITIITSITDWNDVNTYTVEEILNHRFFQKDLLESWNNDTDSKTNPLMVRYD